MSTEEAEIQPRKSGQSSRSLITIPGVRKIPLKKLRKLQRCSLAFPLRLQVKDAPKGFSLPHPVTPSSSSCQIVSTLLTLAEWTRAVWWGNASSNSDKHCQLYEINGLVP